MPLPPTPEGYLTKFEAAAYCGITPTALIKWDDFLKPKLIPNKTGFYRYYLKADLDRYLELKRDPWGSPVAIPGITVGKPGNVKVGTTKGTKRPKV